MSEPLTFGSLFAGIGGFDLGFERAGMNCRWQVEIDDYANRVLAKHWPNVHRERDILQCGGHNLERVDVICGGFPCQDISFAGRGAGLDGERSGLFFEAVRVVRELQPRVVVLENVAALLTRGLDRVLGTLAAIGYDAEWHCIPAAAVGAPHIRDRVFVFAYGSEHGWDEGQSDFGWGGEGVASWEESRLGDGCCDDVADANRSRCQSKGQRLRQSGKAKNRSGRLTNSGMQVIGRNKTESSQWATEPDVGRVAHGVPRRVDRLRGLGNAVVPQVAEYVGRMVLERLSEG
jgi:DNA (cytosine-5)-methyltransferase 1